jgi:tripartite ATP-independent transporter DctP family solute receptor
MNKGIRKTGKKWSCFMLVLMLIFATALSACGSSGNGGGSESGSADVPSYVIKLGHCDPEDPNDPFHATALAFKEKAEALTDGRVQIVIYPNAQLGDERSVVEQVQNGTTEMTVVTSSASSNFQPLLKLLDFPFMFDSVEEARGVTGGDIGQAFIESMPEVGIKTLGLAENGFRYILNNKHAISAPDDLKSLKLRVMQNPVFISFYEEFGASPVPLAYGELYTAVSQGTVDGFDLTLPLVISSKFYEVTKYMTDIRYTYTTIMLNFNLERFNSYPEDIQAALVEAAAYAREECFKVNDEVEKTGRAFLMEEGMEIVTYDQVAAKDFRAKSETVWNAQADSDRSKELLEKLASATE